MPITTLSGHDLEANPGLHQTLLKLNNDHALELSYLEADRLVDLVDAAFFAACCGIGEALLISFDQSADYDSPNFQWFRERLPNFVYVDRVVTSPHARGKGLAGKLYRELFDRARAAGYSQVVCEVNSDPPNPVSEAFHIALGFEEVGSAVLANGKTVSYLSLRLDDPQPTATFIAS